MAGNGGRGVTVYLVIVLTSLFLPATLFSQAEPAESGNRLDLVFSHRVHVDSAGIGCAACHPAATGSEKGADNLLQPEANCLGCHDKNPCSRCHTDQREPGSFARVTDYSPTFDHRVHISMGLECNVCHARLSDSPAESARLLPGMAPCLDCHNGKTADRDCYLCHKLDEDLVPQNHKKKQWMVEHVGVVMKDRGKACQLCHTNNDCSVCHAGDYLIPDK